jgi:glyoxylase-like metal-dependent hydrolase (beta-lactamase superfamily II)
MTGNAYKFKIGDFDCTVLLDGTSLGDAGFIFSQVDAKELDRALTRRDLHLDTIPNSWNSLLVNTGGQLVLLDTGWGTGIKPEGGRLVQRLRSAGIFPAEIDLVLLSHAHMDHLSGCVGEAGAPVFPNARYLLAQAEWAYWTAELEGPELIQSMARRAREVFSALGPRLEFFTLGVEIVPGIRAIDASGHTPGHTAFEIHSGGERLLYLSDTVLHPLHLEHPDWIAVVDVDPDQTVATRRRIFAEAATDNLLVHFYHFDFPGLGYINRYGGVWKWSAL